MELAGRRVVVTGGAGLVGSHLAARLAPANDVVVLDDLSNGRREWVPDDAEFVETDLAEPGGADAITGDADLVCHLAASKYVDTDRPREQFEANGRMTYNVAERMAEVGVSNLAFTSSSTVYGEAPLPTPEDYAPLEPISVYGASKLADEALLSVYAHSHGFTVWTFRFANVVGPAFDGAVVPDFVEKLAADPERLVILGDGRQEKSYMHIDDCVDAMCHVVERATAASGKGADDGSGRAGRPVNTYNLGTRTTTSVTRIADIVSEEMGLDPAYEYTGGDRGWTGDVPRMRLSIEKLAALGWDPSLSSDESVRRGARQLIELLD